MRIEFIQNGKKYEGYADPQYENGKIVWYDVILTSGHRFTIKKTKQSWKTDFLAIPRYLVHPTGLAIEMALQS